ncbi:hypothetical protein L3i22_044700 [Actinoplanes sp. L3-i22]|nr:hypothetical protein L3i22_044700 [Actinoplanes sp. L3-i22]
MLVSVRARVTAGLAKQVDDVNQQAAPMYAPTAAGPWAPRPVRTSAAISTRRPAVATTSLSIRCRPARAVLATVIAGRSNIRFPSTAPAAAPVSWAPA